MPLNLRDTSLEADEIRQNPEFLHTIFNNVAELQNAIREELTNDSNPKRSLRRRALDLTNYLNTILNNQSKDIAIAFRNSTLATQLKHDATPAPPESHEKLKLFKPKYIKGRLNGNIEALKNGGFKIEHGGETYHADIIINGTGHQNIPQVICNMIDSGVAEYNRKTGTAKTAEDGVRLAGCKIPCAGSAINPGTHGMESNAPIVEGISNIVIKQVNANQSGYSTQYQPQTSNTARHTV